MTANPLPPIPPISATTGMAPVPGSTRFKPVDPIKVLRQYASWLIAAGVFGVILGGGTWFLLNQYMPKWTSQAQLRVENPITQWDQLGGNMEGQREAKEAFMQTEAMKITSEQILRDAMETRLVKDTAWFGQFPSANDAVEALAEDYLAVYPVRNSNLIMLAVGTKDEEDAPRILTAIIEVYMRRLKEEMERTTYGNNGALIQERDRLDEEIRQLNQRLQDFTTRNDLDTLQASQSGASIEYQKTTEQHVLLSSALSQASEALAGAEQRAAAGQTEPSPDLVSQMENANDVLQVQIRINQYAEEVEGSRQQYGENHKTTKYLASKLEQAKTEKKNLIERKVREYQAGQLERSRQMVAELQGQMATQDTRLKELTARMTDLTNKLQQYEDLADRLKSQKEKRDEVEAALQAMRITVQRPDFLPIQQHANPTKPLKTFPRIEIVVPGVTLLVLGLTGGLIFLRELLDQRIKSPTDVKLLPDVDLLGVLPDASEDPSAPSGVERVVEKYPTGLMAEQYRQVRTAILAKMDRRGYKTLMLVGGQPGSGVSTVAQNLATSLAFNGRDVLIVDANLRRPCQHKIIGAANDVGLIDVIQGRVSPEKAIVQLDGVSVSMLPAGRCADATPEILESAACRSMLGALESRYDVVIIDAPPALLASESQLLAKHVDAMAIVVRAVSDERGMVERMLKRLDGHRADVLGIILNGVRSSAGGYFRKNYRDFYRYREQPLLLEDTRGRLAKKDGETAVALRGGSNGSGNGHAVGRSNDADAD